MIVATKMFAIHSLFGFLKFKLRCNEGAGRDRGANAGLFSPQCQLPAVCVIFLKLCKGRLYTINVDSLDNICLHDALQYLRS